MFCRYCNTDQPEDSFSIRKSSGNRISKCKTCVVKYTQEHYEKNKQQYKDRAKADRPAALLRWKEFIASLNLACVQCGENHPAVLDFHHTDPSVKEDHPANLRLSKKRFLKEIETCIVLCSNCHRKLHWDQRQDVGG